MTELKLYKFINEYETEYHWHGDEVIMFVIIWQVEAFNNLLGHNIFDENGVECVMKHDYVCFKMFHICEYFGIKLENVFTNKNR